MNDTATIEKPVTVPNGKREAPAELRVLTHEQVVAEWPTLHPEDRRQLVAQTAHVHNVPHLVVITTEPLAHLMEACSIGADVLVLQPRHGYSALTIVTVGKGAAAETLKVKSVEPEIAPLPDGLDPAIAKVLGIGNVVKRTLVHLDGVTDHSHAKGADVSADGFDEEQVDASGMVCHDCGQAFIRDKQDKAPLICPRLHGIRDPRLSASGDAAVECGLPPA